MITADKKHFYHGQYAYNNRSGSYCYFNLKTLLYEQLKLVLRPG